MYNEGFTSLKHNKTMLKVKKINIDIAIYLHFTRKKQYVLHD